MKNLLGFLFWTRVVYATCLSLLGVLFVVLLYNYEEPYREHHPEPEGFVVGGSERSPKWPTVRKNFLKTHGRCEACRTKYDLNVHHVKPFHLYPELELDPDNLITLCRECHLKYGHACDDKGRVNWSCENPNVREDVKKARKR